MLDTILKVVVTSIVSGIIGWLSSYVKQHREKDKQQEEALKCLLRSSITSKYYVYKQLGVIPYYEKENCNYMYAQYKKMKGNSYVDEIMRDINNLKIGDK